MNNLSVSKLVGSSTYLAIADDSLKDEDNAAWVMELEPEVRHAWINSIGWIRLVDRLAETELLDVERDEFQQFQEGWEWLMATGKPQPISKYRKIFQGMRERWFEDVANPANQLAIQSWDRYVQAISTYHREKLIFENCQQFEQMLQGLGASFFQVFPFVEAHQWRMIGSFGAVDQFYNILRDLREDAEQGICYLPSDVLERFGVSRQEMLELRAYSNPGYRPMMQFWLHDYLPQLYRTVYPFILASDLHPSWRILRDWSLIRYKRIERIFRRCDYDYVRFPQVYWREVKRDLVLSMPGRYGKPTMSDRSTEQAGSSGKSLAFPNRKCKLTQLIEQSGGARFAPMTVAS